MNGLDDRIGGRAAWRQAWRCLDAHDGQASTAPDNHERHCPLVAQAAAELKLPIFAQSSHHAGATASGVGQQTKSHSHAAPEPALLVARVSPRRQAHTSFARMGGLAVEPRHNVSQVVPETRARYKRALGGPQF
jgi:hypothetical protein